MPKFININAIEQDTMVVYSTTDFTRDINPDDGIDDGNVCMVVDEGAYKVQKYCLAFKGHWIDL